MADSVKDLSPAGPLRGSWRDRWRATEPAAKLAAVRQLPWWR
jgi:hypothetical protein